MLSAADMPLNPGIPWNVEEEAAAEDEAPLRPDDEPAEADAAACCNRAK